MSDQTEDRPTKPWNPFTGYRDGRAAQTAYWRSRIFGGTPAEPAEPTNDQSVNDLSTEENP